MLCPKCGTENNQQAEACINCDERLIDEEAENAQSTEAMRTETHQESRVSESAARDKTQPPPRITNVDILSDEAKAKPVVSSGLNIGVIFGTILIPLIGIAMGFTYMRKTHPDAKKAGKTWLIIGLISLLIQFLIVSGK